MRNSGSLHMFEDQVLCPVCLEVFQDPVTTGCSHNFCMTCLQAAEAVLATEGCSMCRGCLLEEHKNHDTTPLEEERLCMEVEVRKVQANVDNRC
ncbi:Nuclear factor 7, brain [Heterocephalus glaber]|uniref:Nuclear factor 7, brain n=1 Tax=Heterocephalus glaber TaxID=10181 RepID=G5BND0_HETGA|nr:Nuclear factor 7, brain [Heterocephalus glaber]